jgi:hypothetical protein
MANQWILPIGFPYFPTGLMKQLWQSKVMIPYIPGGGDVS